MNERPNDYVSFILYDNKDLESTWLNQECYAEFTYNLNQYKKVTCIPNGNSITEKYFLTLFSLLKKTKALPPRTKFYCQNGNYLEMTIKPDYNALLNIGLNFYRLQETKLEAIVEFIKIYTKHPKLNVFQILHYILSQHGAPTHSFFPINYFGKQDLIKSMAIPYLLKYKPECRLYNELFNIKKVISVNKNDILNKSWTKYYNPEYLKKKVKFKC